MSRELKYIPNFYGIILTTVLAIVNIFLFYRIINFDAKFDSLKEAVIKIEQNKKPSDKNILISQFKEESYIRQQERDTTLVLLVFTFFASAVAFITYKGFVNKIIDYTTTAENKYADHKAEYEKQHNIILELKSRLDFDSAIKYERSAYDFYDKKMYGLYLENMLYSLKYYTDNFLHIIGTEGDSTGLFTHEQISTLEEVYTKIKNKSVQGVSMYSTYKNIKEIRQFNNREVDIYLDLISAKITKDNPNKKAPK